MKTRTSFARLVLYSLLLLMGIASSEKALAQGTAFMYQGRLVIGGAPANGSYDLAFTLYATNVTGGTIAGPLTNAAVGVTNGVFTTTINFGNVFLGASNWLEIAVSTNGANSFTTLAPRQQLTPVPYAITAENVSGVISAAQLPASVVTNGAFGLNLSGTFSGNGAQLANVTASALATNALGVAASTSAYATFATNGTYTFIVPVGANQMTVKLWGAGGGHGQGIGFESGGAGAYSKVTLNVTPGDTYVIVVGQNGTLGGGAGANDGSGGAGTNGLAGDFGGYGGQASSLFKFTGSEYIMKAVAGGGGGGGPISNTGGPGTAAGSGAGYSTNATTIGETSLNLMGGDGASGAAFVMQGGTGGGGGYSGGGSGSVNGGPSGGGGSYGDVTYNGGDPGSIGDPNYLASSAASDTDGLAVVLLGRVPMATLPLTVQATSFIGDGSLLTSLNAAQLTGTIPLAQLPASVVTNGPSGVNLTGVFSGNGGGLISLNASQLTSGTVADGRLSGNVALRSGGNAFSGTQTITGGSVGIGTNSPTANLNIVGGNNNNQGIRLQNTSVSGSHFWNIHIDANGDALVFSHDNQWPGVNYSYLSPSSAGLITTSDARAKKDVAPIPSCLDRLMALTPSTFRYREAGEDTPLNYGFIAQDVERQFPDLVSERNGLKTLVGAGLTAVNTRAIQDLKQETDARNQKAEARIQQLESENTELKGRLATLEKMVREKR